MRTRPRHIAKVLFCQAKNDGSLKSLPPTLLAEEKEEAKAVLTLFLKKQGLSNAVELSKIHSKHKFRYLVGRELTTLEIRDALIPYLEPLFEEYGDILMDFVEDYPNPPVKEKPTVPISIPSSLVESKKRKAMFSSE